MKPIARIRSDFATKFGIPRQSGVVGSLQAEIVFEPEFRSRDAVRGLEAFSHIWLIWEFSENVRAGWSPTVRPPRLGGNVRMGVFATRSPFRPNPIGLSCVRLERIEFSDARGPVLHVAGADLMDGTPIYDIKPYIPYADCRPEATEGFTGQIEMHALTVSIPPELLSRFPAEKRDALIGVLAQDPRPRYQTDASRVYGLEFGGYEVKFSVNGQNMTVTDITEKRLVKSRVFFIFQLIQVGAPRAQDRDLRTDGVRLGKVNVTDQQLGRCLRLRLHAPPRVAHERVRIGNIARRLVPRRSAARDKALVIQRPRAKQQLPVRRAGRHIERRRHHDQLRALECQNAKELSKAHVKTDRHAEFAKRCVHECVLLSGRERVRLEKSLAARHVDVKQMHLTVLRPLRPCGSNT